MYAHREEFHQHGAAVEAVTELVEGAVSWGLPIFVAGEFLRVCTHPNVLDPPSDERTAVGAIDALFSSRSLRLLSPSDRYWEIFGELIVRHRVRGNIVHDAQIAAVCLEHGATTILTEDRDFERFAGVKIQAL